MPRSAARISTRRRLKSNSMGGWRGLDARGSFVSAEIDLLHLSQHENLTPIFRILIDGLPFVGRAQGCQHLLKARFQARLCGQTLLEMFPGLEEKQRSAQTDLADH